MNKEHTWSTPDKILLLSKEPIGIRIAEQVARRLIRDDGRHGIWYTHRDYCGHGLICINGSISMVEVYDGFADEGTVLRSWDSQSDFADWLSKQSDYSLSGADNNDVVLYTTDSFFRNNQRLTLKRMLEYIEK